MSNAVFPALPGAKFLRRKARWKTDVQETVSGTEYRQQIWQTQRVVYAIPFEFLRAEAATPEFQQLSGFFDARRGRFDDFLFDDPDDRSVSNQALGVGNGVTTQFQLVRTRGGVVLPVYDLNGPPTVLVNGITQSTGWTVAQYGVLTFTVPPANGATIAWTGNFYIRCRFMADEEDFEQFWRFMWKTKSDFEFISLKPPF
jgi:uncharacterized protein (TIGR02217 family)